MAKAKAKRPKTKRPKQEFIPGTAPPSIPEIDAAAETYVDARDERSNLSIEEKEAHDNLLGKMKEHNLDRYEFDGRVVTRIGVEKCAVKKKKSDNREDGEE